MLDRRASLLAVVLGAACTVEPTQLVVVLDSDLEVPVELDAVEVEIEGRGVMASRGPFVLGGDAGTGLPASFGLAPVDRDATRRVTVRLVGSLDGAEVLTTYARTGFVEHKQLRLDLYLARRCLVEAPACAERRLVCTERGCENPDRPPETLPEWDGRLERARDAGVPVDADVPVDAGDAGNGCPDEAAGPGIVAWSRAPGSILTATDAAPYANGDAIVVGTFSGAVSFADGTCWAEGDSGAFVARILSDGEVGWVHSLRAADGEVDAPRVAVEPAGDSALVAVAIPSGSVTVQGVRHGDGDDGLLVGLDRDGLVTQVLELRTDLGWQGVELVADGSGVALVGTAEGSFEVDGLVGGAVDDYANDTAVAIRWSSDLSEACVAAFPADQGSHATHAALFGNGVLAASGGWSGTLTVGDASVPAGARSYFITPVDETCAGGWQAPFTGGGGIVAHAIEGFAGGVLDIQQDPTHILALPLTADGRSGTLLSQPHDQERLLVTVEPAGDEAVLLVGTTVGQDPPASWLAVLDAGGLRTDPAGMGVPIDAAAVDDPGQTVLIAGSVQGTDNVPGFGALGAEGRAQVYAIRVPLP